MLLPSRVPTKLTQRVDFRPEDYRKLIHTHGLRVEWSQSAPCPCQRVNRDLATGMGYAVEPPTTQTTGEARTDCDVCKGIGVLYHSAQNILAAITTVRSKPELFQAFGSRASGMAAISLLPEHLPRVQDKFKLLDSAIIYAERRIRTASTVESLRYPILTRTVDLASGATPVGVLYAHRAATSGVATAGDAMVAGVDFVVDGSGNVDWTLGDGLGSAPVEGAAYTMVYNTAPTFIVTDHPHVVRDTWIGAKKPAPEHQALPVQCYADLQQLGAQ